MSWVCVPFVSVRPEAGRGWLVCNKMLENSRLHQELYGQLYSRHLLELNLDWLLYQARYPWATKLLVCGKVLLPIKLEGEFYTHTVADMIFSFFFFPMKEVIPGSHSSAWATWTSTMQESNSLMGLSPQMPPQMTFQPCLPSSCPSFKSQASV